MIGFILFTLFVGIATARISQFDFHVFVFQWDPNLSSSEFTIHGLWPQNNDATYPQFCAQNDFASNKINDLLTRMNEVWPAESGDNLSLWSHEWEKHGTCSSLDIRTYFSRAIELHSRYDIKTALEDNGIAPGELSRYTKNYITQSLYDSFGYNPALHCRGSLLVEVALCLSKSFKLMHCPYLGSYFACPTQITF